MITITNKTDCCGCGACASRCVTSCITMAPDEEGFNYPLVDTDKCIHCGLCERVCPLLHKPQPHEILAVIGCKNKNEAVRFVSSSGGFFSLAAEKILGRQGTVFGAAFDDNWQLPDPTGQSDQVFLDVIQQIHSRVEELIQSLS